MLTNLEDENHPEGSAEGENCKEKMESKEESYPNRNCHEDRHRVSFVDQLDQNLGNHRSEENKFASLVDAIVSPKSEKITDLLIDQGRC